MFPVNVLKCNARLLVWFLNSKSTVFTPSRLRLQLVDMCDISNKRKKRVNYYWNQRASVTCPFTFICPSGGDFGRVQFFPGVSDWSSVPGPKSRLSRSRPRPLRADLYLAPVLLLCWVAEGQIPRVTNHLFTLDA